jgi:hypothetical protein
MTPTCAVPGCPVQTPRRVCYFHAKEWCPGCGQRAEVIGGHRYNHLGFAHECPTPEKRRAYNAEWMRRKRAAA